MVWGFLRNNNNGTWGGREEGGRGEARRDGPGGIYTSEAGGCRGGGEGGKQGRWKGWREWMRAREAWFGALGWRGREERGWGG